MREHELRQQVVREMHLRRWGLLTLPSIVVQWVLMVGEEERAAEAEAISARSDPDRETGNPTHHAGRLSEGIVFAWERHSEGSSLTLFIENAGEEAFLDLGARPDIAEALDWARSVPGRIVRATRILCVAADAEAEKVLPRVGYSRPELISCHIGGGVRIWSDFRLKDDGFGALVVAANGADPRDFTRLVQRLQELGNYRNKALLGLPVAHANWPLLNEAEARLTALADRVAHSDERDDVLMEELSELSLRLMAVSTSISFRMSATAAYARLVEERLEQLEVRAIEGFASLTDFTQRRFLPAVRTCAALVERERQLSLRAAQLSSLLRARIETRIENQNARLLRSMERSTTMQLRLQQLVEGLSVVALSYYLLGLVGYLLKGLEHRWPGTDSSTVLAVLVIPVALAVWIAVRLLKSRLLGKD